MRTLLLTATLLTACPSAPPRPLPDPGGAALRPPLIDARDFIAGRLVAAPGGWRFEGAAQSGVVAWPTGPTRAGCHSPSEGLAWPIEGTDRALVLGAEPVLVEERDGCLVATPLRTARAELGRRQLALTPEAPPAVPLFDGATKARVGDIAGFTLTFEERGLPWLATGAATRIEPDGFELDESDELRCWEPEPGEEADPTSPPRARKLELVWRGAEGADRSHSIEELELVVTQTCGGDPSDQGGAVAFERTTRWLLERDPAAKGGWRQAHLGVASRQGSGGDGAAIHESSYQVVNRWSAGEATLVGRSSASMTENESNFGGGKRRAAREGWWVVPSAELAAGLDAIDLEAQGLALAPDLRPTERDAEQIRQLTAPGEVALGPCVARFEGGEGTLTCGAHEDGVELLEADGDLDRTARSWDLGAALCVELELGREQRFPDPDDDSYTRTVQETEGARFLVSKRSGVLLKVGDWQHSSSL